MPKSLPKAQGSSIPSKLNWVADLSLTAIAHTELHHRTTHSSSKESQSASPKCLSFLSVSHFLRNARSQLDFCSRSHLHLNFLVLPWRRCSVWKFNFDCQVDCLSVKRQECQVEEYEKGYGSGPHGTREVNFCCLAQVRHLKS